jgi:hypothetical protein
MYRHALASKLKARARRDLAPEDHLGAIRAGGTSHVTRKTGTSVNLGPRPISAWKAALLASAFAAATVLPQSAAGATSLQASAAAASCSGDDLYVCATSVPRGGPSTGCSGDDLYVCATSVPRWTAREVA